MILSLRSSVVSTNEGPVSYPGVGRVFRSVRRVRLGDVTPRGRLRLDSAARFLQDIANDDAVDGKYSDIHGWVVRKTEMWVYQFPSYMTDVTLTTWCGGLGSHWAERRTTITSPDGPVIEAAAIWVHVDLKTLKPVPLPRDFIPLVSEAANGRKVKASLTIGRGLGAVDRERVVPWPLRFVDFDAVGHVNNANYWVAAEEFLATHRDVRGPLHVTVEHHLPIEPKHDVGLLTDQHADRVIIRHVIDGDRVAAVTQIIKIT
jgi:acyl-ACP thioesterase